MGSRVRVERFDDLDESVRPDVQSYEFGFGGVNYEIDLHSENFAEFELLISPYIKAGRKAKRQKAKPKAKVAATATADTQGGRGQWSAEIKPWAIAHGYDWDDEKQRKAVRQWAIDTGLYSARSGMLPRHVMEAHHQGRITGQIEWPFAE